MWGRLCELFERNEVGSWVESELDKLCEEPIRL